MAAVSYVLDIAGDKVAVGVRHRLCLRASF